MVQFDQLSYQSQKISGLRGNLVHLSVQNICIIYVESHCHKSKQLS